MFTFYSFFHRQCSKTRRGAFIPSALRAVSSSISQLRFFDPQIFLQVYAYADRECAGVAVSYSTHVCNASCADEWPYNESLFALQWCMIYSQYIGENVAKVKNTVLLSLRKVLVTEDPRGPIYKSLLSCPRTSSLCPWTLKPELTARVDGWPVSITRQYVLTSSRFH